MNDPPATAASDGATPPGDPSPEGLGPAPRASIAPLRPGAVASQPAGLASRTTDYLRRHPAILLVLLSPGIPEYLSTSSPVDALVLNPGQFAFQLVANLGLYGPGVLLVREAMVRGHRSWPSLLALGSAYAILEEGVGLSTMFDPHAAVAGTLGSYGHFAGVSWLWALGLVMVHTVYSLAIPIVLLGLALPETRGRSLLSPSEIRRAFGILALDVTGLVVVVAAALHFFAGAVLLGGALALIGLLVYVGLRVGPGPYPPARAPPLASARRTRLALVGLGVALLPATFLVQGISEAIGLPAAVAFGTLFAGYAGWTLLTVRLLGRPVDDRSLLVLVTGLLVPIVGIGVVASLPLPGVVILDAVAVAFLLRLYHRYPSTANAVPSPSPGAVAG